MKLDPKKIKKRVIEIAHKTGAGHAPSALSCVELLCKVYEDKPDDAIIILSKGHGALAQYVILNELGILPDKILDTYHTNGGLSEHTTLMPEYGIYASTGSLGHGVGIGIGYALANPKRQVLVIIGDGELDEGSTYEALRFIFTNEVNNIRPIVDFNGSQGFKLISKYMPAIFGAENAEYGRPYSVYYGNKNPFGDANKVEVASHYLKVKDIEEWTKAIE